MKDMLGLDFFIKRLDSLSDKECSNELGNKIYEITKDLYNPETTIIEKDIMFKKVDILKDYELTRFIK